MIPAETRSQVQDPIEQQFSNLFSEWAATLGLRLRGSLHLALAEARLAVSTLVLVVFLIVLSAGAIVLAWGLLLLALVQALSLAGLTLTFALIFAGLLHIFLAWALWRVANRLSGHMEFRTTRRLLEG